MEKPQEPNLWPDFVLKTVMQNRSEQGIFGFEINWLQLAALNSFSPIQYFFGHRIVWFMLRRRDLLAQAISLYLANKTKVYHSYQMMEVPAEAKTPEFDGPALTSLMREIVCQEEEILRWATSQQVTPIMLYYEDIVSDPAGTVQVFSNVLRLWGETQASSENQIRKIGSQVNDEFAAVYRDLYQGELDALLARRPTVFGPVA